VKYYYCPKCRRAFVKSRFEKTGYCGYCRGECETVEVRRNMLYYIGYGIMIAGAAIAVLPRFMTLATPEYYSYGGLGIAIFGAVVVFTGSTRMAKDAAEAVKRKLDSGKR
jgi:hypothetical protein